jgi:protein required for attachment to host cells
MTKPAKIRPIAPLDWVLVANAARARCFERDAENGAMRELRSFVHPSSRLPAQDLSHDRGGKAMKSQARTQFAPHTDPLDKEHVLFARELARHLEQAALAHEFPALTLFASPPFLGELRNHLGPAVQALLRRGVPLDLTRYEGAELEERVAVALADSAV